MTLRYTYLSMRKFRTMKRQICFNAKTKMLTSQTQIGMAEAVRGSGGAGFRIFVVHWSNRKHICRLPKMANSRSEGVRR